MLICWDGSDGAARTTEEAGAILGPGREAIVLFAHVPTEASEGILGGWSAPDAPIMAATDAEVLMEDGLRIARQAGFEPRPLLVVAKRRTSEIIASVADEQETLLIAIGQRRRSGVGRVLLGPVAREVVEAHHRPVLDTGPNEPGPYPRL